MKPRTVAQPLLTLRIIWGALTFSTLLYGFVLTTLGPGLRFSVPESYTPLEAVALALGALLFVTYAVHEKKVIPEADVARRFPYYVVCWALHEAIVVVAFAAVFLSADKNLFVYAVNLVLTLFGNVLTFPRAPVPRG
jgi:hypothetical protein